MSSSIISNPIPTLKQIKQFFKTTTTTTTFIILISYIVQRFFIFERQKKASKLHGNFGLPLLGETLEFLTAPHEWSAKKQKQYGPGPFISYLFFAPTITVGS